MTLAQFKPLVLLGVAFATWYGTTAYKDATWGQKLTVMETRAQKAETENDKLTEANKSLETANFACNRAATAQAAANQAAQARRETLDDILTCPTVTASPASQAAAAVSPKGEALNDNQNRQMVDFYNGLFAGLGLRGQ